MLIGARGVTYKQSYKAGAFYTPFFKGGWGDLLKIIIYIL
jgi:hypothetical protein